MKPAKSRIEYNKLVRDRIPEIIEDSGKQCVYSILDNEAYRNNERSLFKRPL
mgnify:CR=1 FL=1